MDLIINNMASLFEIDWVDDLVKSIPFVAVQVLRLSSVSCESTVSIPDLAPLPPPLA